MPRNSIFSAKTLPTTSMASGLRSGSSEYSAHRYGGNVACSSSIGLPQVLTQTVEGGDPRRPASGGALPRFQGFRQVLTCFSFAGGTLSPTGFASWDRTATGLVTADGSFRGRVRNRRRSSGVMPPHVPPGSPV
ncbi:hypothetical protein [Nonomuraea sp. NPDC049480]|uniref:hypothetical protein n=1 Tax=Nonomuraea sp. NPDC049480 TaxID=3364353 RepID=UPI0037B2C933